MRLRRGDGNSIKEKDLYPIFKYTVTEQIEKTGISLSKLYKVAFYSQVSPTSSWKLEYESNNTRMETERLDTRRIISILRDNFGKFQKKTFENYLMFIADGIVYKNPSLDYAAKELTGELVNKDLYSFLGPSKVNGDIGTFDFIELHTGAENRIVFFEKDDIVIVGAYLYQNGFIVMELTPDQSDMLYESSFDFCDTHGDMMYKLNARNIYHENELLLTVKE